MKTNWISFLILLATICQCSKEDAVPRIGCAVANVPTNRSFVRDNTAIKFSWLTTGTAFSYDLYLGVGSNPPEIIAADLKSSSYNYEIPAGIDITYTWYVKTKNKDGVVGTCKETPSTFTTKSLPPFATAQRVVNVLVLNYDPTVVTNGDLGFTARQLYAWQDPHWLADEYISDVLDDSQGLVKYNIVEWRDLDEFPAKIDGFVYTRQQYLDCMGKKEKCHSPDDLDYEKMFEDQEVVKGINEGKFEELWIFGGPYFGYWEAAMAGPGSFYTNGGIYSNVVADKAFAIMGFNYERGVAEMLHDLSHRTEGTMSTVYGIWDAKRMPNAWSRFAANVTQSDGFAGVGSCHWPPNAKADYDYANTDLVLSTAEDWKNYPFMTGATTGVNCQTWGGPDYHRNYLNWWFRHLPRRDGEAPDQKLNNWWRYIFEFNETVIK
jgi:hypothetical protein